MTYLRIRSGMNQVGDKADKYLIEEVTNGMVTGQLHQPLLPNRRPTTTMTMYWNGSRYHLAIGFHPETGRPAEAFIYGAKVGSEMDALLDDSMISLSRLLQSGHDPAKLAKSYGGQSIIGAVAERVAKESPYGA